MSIQVNIFSSPRRETEQTHPGLSIITTKGTCFKLINTLETRFLDHVSQENGLVFKQCRTKVSEILGYVFTILLAVLHAICFGAPVTDFNH